MWHYTTCVGSKRKRGDVTPPAATNSAGIKKGKGRFSLPVWSRPCWCINHLQHSGGKETSQDWVHAELLLPSESCLFRHWVLRIPGTELQCRWSLGLFHPVPTFCGRTHRNAVLAHFAAVPVCLTDYLFKITINTFKSSGISPPHPRQKKCCFHLMMKQW